MKKVYLILLLCAWLLLGFAVNAINNLGASSHDPGVGQTETTHK